MELAFFFQKQVLNDISDCPIKSICKNSFEGKISRIAFICCLEISQKIC